MFFFWSLLRVCSCSLEIVLILYYDILVMFFVCLFFQICLIGSCLKIKSENQILFACIIKRKLKSHSLFLLDFQCSNNMKTKSFISY